MDGISKGNLFSAALFSCFLLISGITSRPALAEDVLGVWCLKPDPNNRIYNQVITIKATDYGTYEAHIEMLFGFPEVFDLYKAGDSNFQVSGGVNQEGYRINSDGTLEFYNMYESVGFGVKIPEGQNKQDCFN